MTEALVLNQDVDTGCMTEMVKSVFAKTEIELTEDNILNFVHGLHDKYLPRCKNIFDDLACELSEYGFTEGWDDQLDEHVPGYYDIMDGIYEELGEEYLEKNKRKYPDYAKSENAKKDYAKDYGHSLALKGNDARHMLEIKAVMFIEHVLPKIEFKTARQGKWS